MKITVDLTERERRNIINFLENGWMEGTEELFEKLRRAWERKRGRK